METKKKTGADSSLSTTCLDSRPKPSTQDIRRAREPFERGLPESEYEDLVLIIDRDLPANIRKEKAERPVVIAKLINELRALKLAEDGDDEGQFVEAAKGFLGSRSGPHWFADWFKPPAKITVIEPVRSSATGSSKTAFKTKTTQPDRAPTGLPKITRLSPVDKRGPTMHPELAIHAEGLLHSPPPTSSTFMERDELGSLPLSPTSRQHSSVSPPQTRKRRVSDTALVPGTVCLRCGLPPQQHLSGGVFAMGQYLDPLAVIRMFAPPLIGPGNLSEVVIEINGVRQVVRLYVLDKSRNNSPVVALLSIAVAFLSVWIGMLKATA